MKSNPFTNTNNLFGNETKPLFGGSLFNQSNSLFETNNSNNFFSNNNSNKKEEGGNLNFGTNLFGTTKEGKTKNDQNNSSSLFSSNPFTNPNNNNFSLFGSTNKDNNKTGQTQTPLFGFNNTIRNNGPDNNKASEISFNPFAKKENNTKKNENTNKTQGLFGIDNNNNNLFKSENITTDTNLKKNDNISLFDSKINNNIEEQKPEIKLFSNQNNPFFNPIPKSGEKAQIEVQNKININENSEFNPFNESSKSEINNNNFGSIFSLNNNQKEEPNSNNEKSQNLFETNENKEENKFSIFNKKENENNLFTSEDKKEKRIINNQISNNNILFDNNNNEVRLFTKNDNKDDIEEEEINDMDIEMDKKDESSSKNSDYINNLWISDDEEIIDDDIDINKKIDYKKVEEKSKNIPNNINDLNSLIIPELSEFYFNLMKSLDNNINYNSNLNNSIELSSKILSILKDKIEFYNDNIEKKNELINITTIYAYFDSFILHRNDIIYLMKLRDEIFYKYYVPIETAIDVDKNKSKINDMNSNNIGSIINILENIYFHLSLLDLSKAKQKILELNRIYKEILRERILGDKTLIFNDLFLNIEKIIKIYNNIYNLKDNLNSKQIISSFNMNLIFQEVREIIFELQKSLSNNKDDDGEIKILFNECQKICGMLLGNIEYIINDNNKKNIHSIILGNIFYRFYLNDFIKELQKCLNKFKSIYNENNNLVDNYIAKIIKNCDSNQLEIVQELKGSYPFLLRYHMIEILSQNNFIYQIENKELYLKNESYLLFQMLKDSKIKFKYYLNYFLFYPNYEIFTLESANEIKNLPEEPSDKMREEGYRKALDYALIYITYRFNNYDNIEELIDEINEIKNEIREKIKNTYSFDIIYKINKLCLNKFIEKNIYKYAIEYYIDNYKLENEDFQKLQIYEMRKQLCAENELNYDYSKQFDKVIIHFYLETNYLFNLKSFRENYETNKNKVLKEFNDCKELLKIILNKKNNSPIDNYILFMINYIEFLVDVVNHNLNIITRNNKNNVNIVSSTKKFFENCFPLPKCPSFIWYDILHLIKIVIDDNISLFNNDTFSEIDDNTCEQLFVWDKKLIYELMKTEKMKKNNINLNEAQKMYEKATTFFNDIIQGVYFNQNIFSIPNQNYY